MTSHETESDYFQLQHPNTRYDTVLYWFPIYHQSIPRNRIMCTLNPRKDQGTMSHKRLDAGALRNAILSFG